MFSVSVSHHIIIKIRIVMMTMVVIILMMVMKKMIVFNFVGFLCIRFQKSGCDSLISETKNIIHKHISKHKKENFHFSRFKYENKVLKFKVCTYNELVRIWLQIPCFAFSRCCFLHDMCYNDLTCSKKCRWNFMIYVVNYFTHSCTTCCKLMQN